MAIARWELEQRQKGNVTAAEVVRVLREQYGDVPLTNYLLPEQFGAQEQEKLSRFFDREVAVPTPPQELSIAMLKAKEIGWAQAEPHFLPKMELKQNSDVSEWTIRPEDWYWQKIREGKVAKDAATLEGIWVVVDGSQKPQYKDGKQMYENDPFAPVLTQLRRDGKIQVPDWCRNIPKDSRFGVSHDELQSYVNPGIANLLDVQPKQVRLPKAIEFNILGNLAHPEWGKTNTWEWFSNNFGAVRRLIGGRRDRGGLADVDDDWHGHRHDYIGFRLQVASSS